MKDLITVNAEYMSNNKFNFKDARLTEAANQIQSIALNATDYAATVNRQIASILGQVKTDKSYETDGFKSVAEFAEHVFGIKRAAAYQLAAAGEVYNSPDSPETLKQMTPANLAELSTVPADKLNAAIADGTITAQSKQSELREFAQANKDKPDSAVVKTYDPNHVGGTLPVEIDLTEFPPDTIDGFKAAFSNRLMDCGAHNVEVIDLKKSVPASYIVSGKPFDNVTPNTRRTLFIYDNTPIIIEYHEHNPKSSKKSKSGKVKTFNINDLTPEQRAELLAQLTATT